MKALVYEGPGTITLSDVPEPSPGPGEVLLAVTAAGVCGTDRHLVDGDLGVAPGTVPGHEIAGTVAAAGPGVDGWTPGTRVVSYGQAVCGTCPACTAGRANRCPRAQVLGISRPGGFAPLVAVPAANLVALPDSVPDTVGAVATDAIATPFHALTAVGRLVPGETVVVVGAGGLGVHAVLLARLAGAARVVAVDPSPGARDAALAAGADAVLDPAAEESPGRALRALARGATLAIECFGSAATVELALAALAPGGRAVVCGVGPERPRLPALYHLTSAEVAVLGSFGSTPSELRAVVDLLASGRLDASASVGRVLPLAAGPALFASPPAPGRTVLRPGPAAAPASEPSAPAAARSPGREDAR